MKRMTLAALLSLAGLIVAIALYSIDPLPASIAWQSPAVWGSIALLGIGLVCFLALLASGLVTVLNWNSDRNGPG